MSSAVRISHKLIDDAKIISKVENRSVTGQIEYWAKIGKCALDNSDLPIEFIKDVLVSKNSDKSLAEPFNFEQEEN